jgi:sugar lactone lactonase YvrE
MCRLPGAAATPGPPDRHKEAHVKRTIPLAGAIIVAALLAGMARVPAVAQRGAQTGAAAPATPLAAPNQTVPQISNVPLIPFEVVPNFFRISPDQNFGETLAVAVNAKGNVIVLNHPGTATSGPLYGNATTQIWEFDSNGKFIREIGKGVYGLGYAHSVRFDKYDNLWVVDKGTNSIMKFNPAGYVTMNLGRRPEGYEGEYHRLVGPQARPTDGNFNAPTDIGWDADDNIYVSDGYGNSRVAKMNKNGDWIKSWGTFGTEHGQFRVPHNLQVDRQGNVYVADRSNGRIQVFDSDGNFKKVIWLNAAYDKKRHPVLGNLSANPPDATAPWALCITTNGPTQYLFAIDTEPGRLYKMTLDGQILGMLGESGRGPKQFNWPHGIACPSEDVVFIADMNNWRVQKLILRPAAKPTAGN